MKEHEGKPIEGILFSTIIGVIVYTSIAAGVQRCVCTKEQGRQASQEAAPADSVRQPAGGVPERNSRKAGGADGQKGGAAKSPGSPKDSASAAGMPGSEKDMRQDYARYVRGTMNRRQMRMPEPMRAKRIR